MQMASVRPSAWRSPITHIQRCPFAGGHRVPRPTTSRAGSAGSRRKSPEIVRISAHGHGRDQHPEANHKTALPVGAARRTFLLSSAVMGAGVGTLTLYPQEAQAFLQLPCRLHNRYILVRHGESTLQQQDRIQSNPGMKYDFGYGLTDTGRQQMKESAEYIQEVLQAAPRWIYTSNFQRAFQSTCILREELYMLFSNVRTEFSGLLDPRKMGALEGMSYAEMEAVWAADLEDDTSAPPPVPASQEPSASTESCQNVYRRALEAFSRLEGSYFGEDIILVSHEDTLSIFCASLYGTDLRRHHLDYPFALGQARMVDLTAPPSNNEYDPKDQRGTYGLSDDGAYVYPDARGAGGDAGVA